MDKYYNLNDSCALITNTDISMGSCLKQAIRKANTIKILAAFIMESGVRLIIDDLKYAIDMGARVQILTGYYLGITEPSALYLLKMYLGDSAEIRIFKHKEISFHPKTYIFENEKSSEIYIGSSNISASALEYGVEWNYRIVKDESKGIFTQFYENFDELFNDHSLVLNDEILKNYSLGWKKNKFSQQAFNSDSKNILPSKSSSVAETEEAYQVGNRIKPYGAQIEVLYYLELARNEVSKGLVVMATGVGKTYLAAFDSKKYEKILFVAHREEILTQAYNSFKKVMPEKSFGMFMENVKDTDADVIFASVQSIGKPKYLNDNWFKRDYFDYIIFDEMHHIAASSYNAVYNYFKPEFMLGLTATPFRMDNKDIFKYCDDNLIYEINLKEAIERDYLVPFNYYGIYDDTDYSEIDFRNGKYNEKELEKALSTRKRAELVLKYYRIYGQKRAIAFCSSINHANSMTESFVKAGIPSASVHSGDGEFVQERSKAISNLKAGELKVLFVVDIFNEGVDIPEVDTILFLRPTESYTIFLQQLGRGLRKSENKTFVNVLDFIGNYKMAPNLPRLLSGKNPMSMESRTAYNVDYPEGCNIQFDMKLMDLFEELKKHDKLQHRLETEFFRLKEQLGVRPSRMDLYEGSDLPTREFFKNGYLEFLKQYNELNDEENSWFGTDVEKFLIELEKMNLQKLYKIPVILTFIEGGILHKKSTIHDIGEKMMEFYKNPQYAVDMKDEGSKDYLNWSIDKYIKLAAKMPIHFINKSSEFFNYDEINKELVLVDSIVNMSSKLLVDHVQDIIQYRLHDKCAKLYKNDMEKKEAENK
ncbi:MAG: type I restriction enzyme EcoKI subunit R [Firmicutes bacterium ADurb.Bin419]|nr:MAG: type I restriction enzyme EcoKI subunit R [Firmicutes bacterium ADurb.Bin419]